MKKKANNYEKLQAASDKLKKQWEAQSEKNRLGKEKGEAIYQKYREAEDKATHAKIVKLVEGSHLYYSKKRQFKDSDDYCLIKVLGQTMTSSSMPERVYIILHISYNPKHPLWHNSYWISKNTIHLNQIQKDYEPAEEKEFEELFFKLVAESSSTNEEWRKPR